MTDYKNTLNLPKTDFPMKGNLPSKEPLIQKKWEDALNQQTGQKKAWNRRNNSKASSCYKN